MLHLQNSVCTRHACGACHAVLLLTVTFSAWFLHGSKLQVRSIQQLVPEELSSSLLCPIENAFVCNLRTAPGSITKVRQCTPGHMLDQCQVRSRQRRMLLTSSRP